MSECLSPQKVQSISVDLRPIVRKLGHGLEEIRIRALSNICLKLEHGVICESDIVQERLLHVKLLEWFKFPNAPNKGQVLELLKRLTKHGSSARTLIEIGGIEFLTTLRSDTPHGLQCMVDEVLEQLLMLSTEDRAADSETTEFTVTHHCQQDVEAQSRQAANCEHQQPGYFPGQAVLHEPQNLHSSVAGTTEQCCSIVSMPWLSLTLTDTHVLASTERSFRSSDTKLVLSACEFLSNVMLVDFPAQVFLQRPTIVKLLLSLVTSRGEHGTCDVRAAALTSLLYLQKALHASLSRQADPSFSWGSHFVLDERVMSIPRSQRARGDGQDGESSDTTPEPEVTVDEEDESVRRGELHLHDYCLQTLEAVLPQLLSAPGSETELMTSLQLVRQTFKLLTTCIKPAVWSNPSTTHICEQLYDIFELVGNCMQQACLRFEQPGVVDSHAIDSGSSRLCYTQLATLLANFLNSLVSLQHATRLPKTLVEAMEGVAMDGCIGITQPRIRDVMLTYLRELGNSTLYLYERVEAKSSALRDCCLFLQSDVEQWRTDPETCTNQMQSAVESLPYHHCLQLIDKTVHFLIYVCGQGTASVASRQVLLALLAHQTDVIRLRCISALLALAKRSLAVTEQSRDSLLFAHSDLLHQLSYCSLVDCQVRNEARELLNILLRCKLVAPAELWSQIKLDLPTLLPVLQAHAEIDDDLSAAIIQLTCLAGAGPSNTETSTGSLSAVNAMRGAARLLYSPHIRLRRTGAKQLLEHLGSETGGLLQSLASVSTDRLAEVLQYSGEQPRVAEWSGNSAQYESSGLQRVLDIFLSDSVDDSICKGAAEQLAIMLQDASLHRAFRLDGGVQRAIQFLHEAVKDESIAPKSSDARLLYVAACSTMLWRVAVVDAASRRAWAHDSQLYSTLIQCAVKLKFEDRTCQEISSLLQVLLFDEISDMISWFNIDACTPSMFAVPDFIAKRFRLPLLCSVVTPGSPFLLEPPAEDDPLIANTSTASRLLHLNWHLAWHSRLTELVDDLYNGAVRVAATERHCAELSLPGAMRLSLKLCDVTLAAKHQLFTVDSCTCHEQVETAVSRLQALVLALPASLRPCLYEVPWQNSFNRFVATKPSSSTDVKLLCRIIHFLTSLLEPLPHTSLLENHAQSGSELCSWLINSCSNKHTALGSLLAATHTAVTPAHVATADATHVLCFRETISLISTILQHKCLDARKASRSGALAYITSQLTQWLNLGDGPFFYNLSTLETCLQALSHLTTRFGWSRGTGANSDSLSLCTAVLRPVLQVVCAIDMGRGTTPFSFMGAGVTRSAALCLQHVAQEMCCDEATITYQNWTSQWLYNSVVGDTSQSGGSRDESNQSAPSLDWLFPLFTYRDPEVRAAGLGICAVLCSTSAGRQLFCEQWSSTSLCSMAVSVIMNRSECSFVRHKAALILCNMTSLAPAVDDPVYNMLHEQPLLPEILWLIENTYLLPEVEHDAGGWTNRLVNDSADDGLFSHTENETDVRAESRTPPVSSATPSQQSVSSQSGVITPVTCSLLSSVIGLLQNLLLRRPDYVCQQLRLLAVRQRLPSVLMEACRAVTSHPAVSQTDMINLLSAITDFINADITLQLPASPDYSSQELMLLCGSELIPVAREHILNEAGLSLTRSVLLLITSLLQCTRVDVVCTALTTTWTSFIDLLALCIQVDTNDVVSLFASLHVITRLAGMTNDSSELRNRLETVHLSDGTSRSFAQRLILPLISTYEALASKPDLTSHSAQRAALMSALGCLLAASNSASQLALEAGLVESLLDQIKDTHTHLNLSSLPPADTSTVRPNKDDALVVELVQAIDLLSQFMINHTDVKTAALQQDICGFVQRFWGWCLCVPALLSSVLRLLTILTQDHAKACELVSCELLRLVVSLTRRELNEDVAVLQSCLQLLTCVLIHNKSTVSHLYKSGLLRELVISQPNTCRVSPLLSVKLRLLAAVTSTPDGQQLLLKTPGALTCLVDVLKSARDTSTAPRDTEETYRLALVILVNMSSNPVAPAKMLKHDELTGVIDQCLQHETDLQLLIVSLLLSIAQHGHKARSELRLVLSIRGIQNAYNSRRSQPDQRAVTHILHRLLALLA